MQQETFTFQILIITVIRRVTTSGIITTIAGTGISGYSGDGGQATLSELNFPEGLVFDAVGSLYIAEGGNNVIRKINTAGIISTVAGNGTSGHSGDGGQATSAELNFPTGIAFDAFGNLYIADDGNSRIRKVNTFGVIATIAGNGTPGYSGDGGQATSAELNAPSRIVIDNIGNLYFSDANADVVRKINTLNIISTIAGTGTAGFSGDGGQATNAELNVSDGVCIDAVGNIYISDEGNNRIRKVNTLGIITTIVGNGTVGYSGDGGQATASELNEPVGVTLDGFGNLYFSDVANNRIRMVTNVGQVAGIEQFATNKEQITIYPNPNNGSFVIESNSTTKQSMQVYDVTGKMVLSQIINSKTNIDAGSLNEGVYNISLISNEGMVNKRLVIVR